MKWNSAIFRKNDIRGIYKKDFDLDFVKVLAQGFVCFCEKEGVITCADAKSFNNKVSLKPGATGAQKLKIALGHDSRLSSPEIAQELACALSKAGADLVFLGLVPSPLCFFASYFAKDIPAVIVVTASHNPPAFNGFKMILNGQSICDQKILHLQKICQSLNNTSTPGQTADLRRYTRQKLAPREKGNAHAQAKSLPYKGKIQKSNMESAYIACLLFLQSGDLRLKPRGLPKNCKPFNLRANHPLLPKPGKGGQKTRIKIAVDCGNGAMGPLAQKVFTKLNLPVKIYWLYARPDGRFPHHLPDPSLAKNLRSLQKTVKQKKCHFGVAFDGDGDRLRVVGKTGKILAGDELMSIFISDILNTKISSPPAPSKKVLHPSIVTDVKCADWFFDFLRGRGLLADPARPANTAFTKARHARLKPKVIMWKSGHSLIRQKTLEQKALFGGELSGHFFFPNSYFPIDDGLYALLRLLHICFKTGCSPEELIFKKQTFETEEIKHPIADPARAQKKLNRLKKFYKNQQHARCSFIDGVRVSFKGTAWGLARFSNTQSEWTFRFGGKTKQDAQKLQKQFYRLLRGQRG